MFEIFTSVFKSELACDFHFSSGFGIGTVLVGLIARIELGIFLLFFFFFGGVLFKIRFLSLFYCGTEV